MFNKYPNNIIGFRVNGVYKVLDFWLDPKWQILDDHVPESVQIKKQKISEETNMVYYTMLTQEEKFQTLFEMLIEVIEYNLDLQRKQDLFTEKMGELKNLFTSLSYDELKQLSFDTPLSIMTKGKKTKKSEKVSDEQVVNNKEADNGQVEVNEEVLEEKTEG